MSEHTEQMAVVQYLHLLERQGKCTYFAIPNSQSLSSLDPRRAAIAMSKLKAEGLRPGVPDLCIIGKGKVLFIEMKKKGGRVRENQTQFIERLNFYGHYATVCEGHERAIEVINEFLSCKITDN